MFIFNSNINTANPIEKMGDFCLTPARYLVGGKKFVSLLSHDKISSRIEVSNYSGLGQKILHKLHLVYITQHKWINTVIKIILVPALVIVPLGILLKTISLLSTNTHRSFSRWSTPMPLTKDNLTKEAYFEIVNHPLRYLDLSYGQLNYTFGPLMLGECACQNGFNRLYSKRRAIIEQQVISEIVNSADKNSTIKILSLGSGSFFSEFMILGQLIQQGFNKIDLIAVDHELDQEAFNHLKQFYQQNFPDIQLSSYKKMDHVHLKPGSLDTAFAIDLPFDSDLTGTKDFLSAHNLVKKGRSSYLGQRSCDLIFTNDNVVISYADKMFSSIVSNLKKLAKTHTKPIEIGLSDGDDHMYASASAIKKSALILPNHQFRISILGDNCDKHLKNITKFIEPVPANLKLEIQNSNIGKKFDLLCNFNSSSFYIKDLDFIEGKWTYFWNKEKQEKILQFLKKNAQGITYHINSPYYLRRSKHSPGYVFKKA